MDREFWMMVWYNLITPTIPFPFFIYRAAATATATATTPWWIVLIVANVIGAAGMLHLVKGYQHGTADLLERTANRSRTFRWLVSHLKRYMFLLQVALNFTLLPDHVSCALAGSTRYSPRRFFLAQCIGRTAHNLPIVLGAKWILSHPWYVGLNRLMYHPIAIILMLLIVLFILGKALMRRVLDRGLTIFMNDDEDEDDDVLAEI